jgi:hypothetical protein
MKRGTVQWYKQASIELDEFCSIVQKRRAAIKPKPSPLAKLSPRQLIKKFFDLLGDLVTIAIVKG